MARRKTVRELRSGVHILETVVGIDRLTCIQVLDAPDNGDLWQFISMLGRDEHLHRKEDIREAIRREVADILRRNMKGP